MEKLKIDAFKSFKSGFYTTIQDIAGVAWGTRVSISGIMDIESVFKLNAL